MIYESVAALAAIVWVDLLLSGDNAVVIALVCRELPAHQQKIGMVLGTVTAILMRVVMMLFAAVLMSVPGLRIVGGLYILWVAFELLRDEIDEESGGKEIKKYTLFGAITTIAIADASMSLDNVIAIAALAKGVPWLMIFGVLFSIPLLVAGAAIIMGIVKKYPIIVWFGAGLLGWVGGGIIVEDPLIGKYLFPDWLAGLSACSLVLMAGAYHKLPKLGVE